ncbi:MAG TPA: hypothetical protein VJ855_06970 [Marinilabiliaceae bacterium]|nr:hypothetical protein [Marinilabiliaceae bacterium]
MKPTFSFSYKLIETGRGKGQFVVDNEVMEFETTHASNPLSDLLQAMVSIIQAPSHLWDEKNNAVVEWYCDKHLLIIEISSPDGKTIHLNLTRTGGPLGEDVPTKKISCVVSLTNFYLIIIQELDQLIKEKGLLNYAQMWQKNEFPLTFFLILKKYLINWKEWKPDVIDSDILESEFTMILA